MCIPPISLIDAGSDQAIVKPQDGLLFGGGDAENCSQYLSLIPCMRVGDEWIPCAPTPVCWLQTYAPMRFVVPGVAADPACVDSAVRFPSSLEPVRTAPNEQYSLSYAVPLTRSPEDDMYRSWSTSRLQGQVWNLADDMNGCREVQKALEDAQSDGDRIAIAFELRTHVLEASRSPYANHVLQKCISSMRPRDSQFIVDELLSHGPSGVLRVAQHQFGCRVLQRLLEHFPPERLYGVVDAILEEAIVLSRHRYGNYLMQHLLSHGDEDHTRRLLYVLSEQISSVASDLHGVTVLGKALEHSDEEARQALANSIASQPHLLISMSAWRHGFQTAKLTLLAASSALRDFAMQELQKHGHTLSSSRYGRKLLAFVENMSQEPRSFMCAESPKSFPKQKQSP